MPPRKQKPARRYPRIIAAKDPLPQCEGPKLSPFVDHKSGLEFRRLLTDPDPDSEIGAHVFEVSIGGKPFALKVFKYYDDEEDDWNLDGSERDGAPLDHLDYYFDPFYNECRAYGKLVDKGLNGAVAVACHGYLMLSAEYESELDHHFGPIDWNRPSEEYEKPVSQRAPLKTIVKDLVLEDTIWKPRAARRILRDLKKIRKLGIYVMDIKPDNYKGGLLVDFSIAITEPHFILEVKPDFQVQGYRNTDLIAFDTMMRDQEVKTTIRAFRKPDVETKRKLRSYRG
ncbi:MAG: hypothetical protein Q9168_002977 [Polycauliona sp. 1 TL-2023]